MHPRPISSLWPADWEEQVLAAVHELGYTDMFTFVRAYPTEGFYDLGKRLDDLAPPAMLSILYYRDAVLCGDIRSAAIDGLIRSFHDICPAGWNNPRPGLMPEINEINLISTWEVELKAVDERFPPLAQAVFNAIWYSYPPKGWKPTGPEDPIIQRAFEIGWPVERKS
jgi:hypothetical protein